LPLGHYLLGALLLDVDQPERAIPQLEVAEKASLRDPRVYFALGSAYSRVGRKQDAARARATFERLSKEAEKSKPAEQ
jgi:predicted Zn-dependent protease